MSMLLERFKEYVQHHSICTQKDKILLAVSGGVDSMVMLDLFARSGYNVGVAHCNFQLRGAEAEEDEVLVERQAQQFGIPFYNMRFETLREQEATGESIQMVARRLRYVWFNELCETDGYTHIAIAHQADDSVETFFINLLRGTGLRGLTGINIINGRLIRPLLFATRKDIIEYAIVSKVNYREDSSNSSTKYLRNKIRLGIVPRIKEISPRFTDTMTLNVERLTSTLNFINRGIEIVRDEVVSVEGDKHTIDLSLIDKFMPVDFVVFELLYPYGFNAEVIDSLYNSLKNGNCGKHFYSKDNVAYIDRGVIIVSPIAENDNCRLEANEQTRNIYCGGSVISFEHLDIDGINGLHQPETIALIDEDKLKYPLEIRRWSEGDSFTPLGMNGHKKVSDFLIDTKVSMPDKMRQFVVTSGGEIVWIVGRRVDERFKVDSSTENVLRLTKSQE